MAARSVLRRLCSRPPQCLHAVYGIRELPALASIDRRLIHGSSVAVEENFSPEQNDNKESKWLTLPPFTPTVNGAFVGINISRNRSERSANAVSSVTALKWVTRCCPELPSSLVQKLFRLKKVRRDSNSTQQAQSKRVSAKDLMNPGDTIYLRASVEMKAPSEKTESSYNEEEMKYLHSLVLYKDPAIIVVNKPHGMPVQGGIGVKRSLDELAAQYLRFDRSESPRLVHRLDRDCSGVLVMGRSQSSAAALHSIFREKTFETSELDFERGSQVIQKTYWALVIGSPKNRKGLISKPLGKVLIDNGKSDRITVVDDTSAGQCAVTEYKVIGTPSKGFTWLELSPLTGRKHQLRVHCAEVLGTPILGDYKYGWQAHKNLKHFCSPVPTTEQPKEELLMQKQDPFNLDIRDGSILDKQPRLHLHCKRMILPDVSLALENAESGMDYDLKNIRSVNLTAPSPYHMQKSWDLVNSGDLFSGQ